MTIRTRKLAAVLGVGGLLAVAAAGCGGSATAAPGTPPSGTQSQPQSGPRGGGGPDFSALAAKLGVSTTQLQQALQSARPAQGAAPTGMAAALAKALNLSEAKVTAALEAVGMNGGPPGGGAPPQGAPGAAPQGGAGQAPSVTPAPTTTQSS